VPTGWCEPYTQLAVAYGKPRHAPQATYAKGMAGFCLKKPEDAKRQLKTLIAGPAKLDALLGLATIAEAESSKAEAITWYQKVITADPTNISAISGLSRLAWRRARPAQRRRPQAPPARKDQVDDYLQRHTRDRKPGSRRGRHGPA